MVKNPAVDKSFREARNWRREAHKLREILLDSGLSEELKWGKPCYCSDGKNICIIQRMKGFLALLFFKGALLKDPDGVLEVQGPNSRAGYRMRFVGVQDVTAMAKSVRAYVHEAIEIEKTGLKVETASALKYPKELVAKFEEDPEFSAAFEKLTPGRKRGYMLHFSNAKQSATRVRRIEKFRGSILQGKGVQER